MSVGLASTGPRRNWNIHRDISDGVGGLMGEERLNVLSKGGDCLLGLLCFLMGYKTAFVPVKCIICETTGPCCMDCRNPTSSSSLTFLDFGFN